MTVKRAFSHGVAAFSLLIVFTQASQSFGDEPPGLVMDSRGHTGLVEKLFFTPDGKKLLLSSKTSNGEKTLIVDSANGKTFYEFSGHNNSVFASAWHPTENLVATSGGDAFETLLWRSSNGGGNKQGEIVHRLVGRGTSVYNVGFSLKGKSSEVVLGDIVPEDYWLPSAPLQLVFDFGTRALRPLKSVEDANGFYTINY